MGLFDRIFGSRKMDKPENDLSFIVEIAELISDKDTNVTEAIKECVRDPWGYGEENPEGFEERGIDVIGEDTTNANEICWICMVDKLQENGYLFSVDYNCEAEDLLWALSQIKTYSLIKDAVSELELDTSKDIEAWAEEINLAISGALVCMINIDSDSYELIIVSHDVYDKISVIAENNGHSIEVF